MIKKVPVRQCIGCGERKEKKELVRIVFDPERGFSIDPAGRSGGRGAYLCPDPGCVEAAGRKKAFSRAFRLTVPAEAVTDLKQQIKDYLLSQELKAHAAG